MTSRTLDLNPERWARVEALFDEAADMPPAERAAFLKDACKDDAELRNYVASLLESDMAAHTLVEDSIRDVIGGALPPDDGADNVGMRIGAYRVVRTIGTGGMGVVYLAERADDEFEQQVAIKVVRQRLLDPDIEKRLLAERQILADLDHPNIARLFDGGTTPDGTPYLVMEYVDGVPIDDYCDRHALTIEQRIGLFRTVCNAIHHAHQNLVVHRDIKPSNILVTGEGTVKLLDFGIARLIDAGADGGAGLTRAGAVILTPENASPEQVRNEPITTATDTYALGILLYRLLTGRAPYLVSMKTPTEIPRIICSVEPMPPSVKVRQPCDGNLYPEDRLRTPHALASARGTTVERLSRRLRGDLDNIVKTALRKEPERRYRTVHEFAEDLRLHLDSHPVLARADTWHYRASRFLKRHTVGAAMSTLLILLLITFAATMSVQNRRIAEERDTATEIATFLEEIFMEPDPGNARGANITAREILKKGAARIATQLDERPAVQATLMSTIGRVYFNLGEYDSSIEMLEESLRIRREELDDGDELARTKDELAAALTRKADYERAEELLNEALEHNRKELGDDSAAVAGNLYNRAELYLATGKTEQAERDVRESVRILSALGEAHAAELAEGKSLLAALLQQQNELGEAEALMRDAISIVESRLGKDHPLLAYYSQNLAVLLQSKGELDAAKQMYDQAIAITRKVLGEDHSLLGGSFVMLGQLLQQREQYDTAETAFRDALAVHRKARGENHPFVGYDHAVLGTLMYARGQLHEAETNLRKALDIYEQSLSPDHQYVASALTVLSAVLTSDGRAREAEPLVARAIDIRRRDYDESHPLLATTLSVAGYNMTALQRYEEAEKLLLDNYATLRDQLGDDDRRTQRVREWLVALYDDWQKPEEAAKYQASIDTGS